MLSLPEAAADAGAIRLPANAATVTAPALHEALVEAIAAGGPVSIDAAEVESVGQAALQLIVAGARACRESGRTFAIVNPSHAFAERLAACCLSDAVGLETGQGGTL